MGSKVVVLGNLNVDYFLRDLGQPLERVNPVAGGTAYNAAYALSQKGFSPTVIGCVGNDAEGHYVQKALDDNELRHIIHVHPNKPTGTCHIFYPSNALDEKQRFIRNKGDANEYDIEFLTTALESAGIQKDDPVFVASDFFVRQESSVCEKILEAIFRKSTKIILDVVPHTIYNRLSIHEFRSIIDDRVHIMIAEVNYHRQRRWLEMMHLEGAII